MPWCKFTPPASRPRKWIGPRHGSTVRGTTVDRSSRATRCRASSRRWATARPAVRLGDAVYGLTDWYRDGAAAEYVAVEARNLAPKPASAESSRSGGDSDGRSDGGSGAVRSWSARGRADRAHPRRGRRRRYVRGAACARGRRAGLGERSGVGARDRGRARGGRIRRRRSRRRRRLRAGSTLGVRPRRGAGVRARMVVHEGATPRQCRSSRSLPSGPMVAGRARCSSSSSPTGRSSASSDGALPRASCARSSVRSCHSPKAAQHLRPSSAADPRAKLCCRSRTIRGDSTCRRPHETHPLFAAGRQHAVCQRPR